MNVLQPVSTIMSTDLKVVVVNDKLSMVKSIFDENNIHHIPVVQHQDIVGMVSKSDFLHYLHGFRHNNSDDILEKTRLDAWLVSDIMIDKLAKLEVDTPIRTALEIFKLNRFHALPVVEGQKLVGILTTYDIINAIAHEPIELTDYEQ